MSIFDIFSGDDSSISCVHCGKTFTTARPKPLKKKVYEKAHWHMENFKEELNNVYIYEHSEVTSTICPHCKQINFLYLDSNHKLFISKDRPKDTYLSKELLKHWIEKS